MDNIEASEKREKSLWELMIEEQRNDEVTKLLSFLGGKIFLFAGSGTKESFQKMSSFWHSIQIFRY